MNLRRLIFTPRIKNIEYPSCKDCVYFIKHKEITFSRCAFFGEKNLVTGELNYKFADLTRKNECGNSGKYFEKT